MKRPRVVYEIHSGNLDWLSPLMKGRPKHSFQHDDAALVQRAIEGYSLKLFPNMHQAAKALAKEATGASEEAKRDRLYRKFRDALKLQTQSTPANE